MRGLSGPGPRMIPRSRHVPPGLFRAATVSDRWQTPRPHDQDAAGSDSYQLRQGVPVSARGGPQDSPGAQQGTYRSGRGGGLGR